MTSISITRPTRRRSHAVLALATLALAIMSVGAGAFSLAYFTATATVGTNSFTTGTISLAAAPASAVIGYTTMMPGDSVTAPLTVSNTGTAQLRYAITGAATNPDTKSLRDQLVLAIKTEDAGGGCAAFTGTSLFSG